ncbi:MAG TPA: tRNA-dihydrouridine synthase [bacterium]|nr:tRNA-dihydrouridine synthase [bacterium]
MSFWQNIRRPIVGLAPMDGVTDAAYRRIAARHGRPDVVLTEFTNVEGLSRGAQLMLEDFIYSEEERPAVAQIYGSEPESFYKVTVLACALGFDGIDVNMGCPAKNVAARGCGAALIRNPALAKEILRAVKRGIADWVDGISIDRLGLKPRMPTRVRRMNLDRIGAESVAERRPIPLSVKTRIGYDKIVVEDWVRHLLEEEPAAISLHGRTLKQMYTGSADWEAIGRAAELIHQTSTLALGNGDLASLAMAAEKIALSGVDGVLIGRGAMGNPWIFGHKDDLKDFLEGRRGAPPADRFPDLETRFAVLLEHARLFEAVKGHARFAAMRKHFAFYCKGMPRAAELRNRMFQTKDSGEVERILADYMADGRPEEERLPCAVSS